MQSSLTKHLIIIDASIKIPEDSSKMCKTFKVSFLR